jgi:CRP-like cAMP-binding protein
MLDILKKASFFKGISEIVLEKLIAAGVVQKMKPAEFLFQQGEPAHTIYLVLEGRLKLVQINENGEEVILRYVGPGESAAAGSALSGIPYPATAEVVQEGQTLHWNGKVLRRLMQRYPEITLNILDIVLERLVDVQNRFLELSTERVEQRIARTLLRLMKRNGIKTEEGILINFPLSRQDIAEHSGTTLHTVSRTLSAWAKKRLIKSSREKIILTDLHALVSISEGLPHELKI